MRGSSFLQRVGVIPIGSVAVGDALDGVGRTVVFSTDSDALATEAVRSNRSSRWMKEGRSAGEKRYRTTGGSPSSDDSDSISQPGAGGGVSAGSAPRAWRAKIVSNHKTASTDRAW